MHVISMNESGTHQSVILIMVLDLIGAHHQLAHNVLLFESIKANDNGGRNNNVSDKHVL
jgi:hypothetical protein